MLSLDQLMETRSLADGAQQDNDQMYIYQHPIRITSTSASLSVMTSNQSNTVTSAVAIFNLALAYHLAGIERGNNATVLRRALSLYEYVLKIVNGRAHGDCTFFTMATINNLGQIERTLLEDDSANFRFHQLLSLLLPFMDSNRMDGMHLEGFINNILQIIFEAARAVAPAAAA